MNAWRWYAPRLRILNCLSLVNVFDRCFIVPERKALLELKPFHKRDWLARF